MVIQGPSRLRGPITQHDKQWLGHNATADVDESPIRRELVDRVKAQIADGTYDTPEKFEAAFLKMLEGIE
ncbi:MAG: flagellar biosynthesis anti-sigma factor FlgM [Gemmataceae bacterium]